MLHDDLRAYVIVAVLAIATVLTGWPKAEGANKPNATVAESTNGKAPKKVKRKGTAEAQKQKNAPEILLWPGNMFWGQPNETKRVVIHPLKAAAAKPQEVLKAEFPRVKTPSTIIKKVMEVAREQLGDPYRYGARGPDSFDCSGFIQFVWSHVGIALPRTSGAQYASRPKVGLDEMKPGDLVYRPGHIGMYVGDGKMIHSPQTGGNVEISPLHDNIGAARVVGN
jgi:cell wall-associated NlpC family hydrolase